MVDALLRRYPGYTLSKLDEEDAELIRIVRLVALAGPQDGTSDAEASSDWEVSGAESY